MKKYPPEYRWRMVQRFRGMQDGTEYTTPKEFARCMGITPSCFWRWLKEEGFKPEKLMSGDGRIV